MERKEERKGPIKSKGPYQLKADNRKRKRKETKNRLIAFEL